MNKPSCPAAAMFFLLLSVNVSLAFGQTTLVLRSVPTGRKNNNFRM